MLPGLFLSALLVTASFVTTADDEMISRFAQKRSLLTQHEKHTHIRRKGTAEHNKESGYLSRAPVVLPDHKTILAARHSNSYTSRRSISESVGSEEPGRKKFRRERAANLLAHDVDVGRTIINLSVQYASISMSRFHPVVQPAPSAEQHARFATRHTTTNVTTSTAATTYDRYRNKRRIPAPRKTPRAAPRPSARRPPHATGNRNFPKGPKVYLQKATTRPPSTPRPIVRTTSSPITTTTTEETTTTEDGVMALSDNQTGYEGKSNQRREEAKSKKKKRSKEKKSSSIVIIIVTMIAVILGLLFLLVVAYIILLIVQREKKKKMASKSGVKQAKQPRKMESGDFNALKFKHEGPLRLDRRLRGPVRHFDTESGSTIHSVEFDPNLNEVVDIGTNVELMDGDTTTVGLSTASHFQSVGKPAKERKSKEVLRKSASTSKSGLGKSASKSKDALRKSASTSKSSLGKTASKSKETLRKSTSKSKSDSRLKHGAPPHGVQKGSVKRKKSKMRHASKMKGVS